SRKTVSSIFFSGVAMMSLNPPVLCRLDPPASANAKNDPLPQLMLAPNVRFPSANDLTQLLRNPHTLYIRRRENCHPKCLKNSGACAQSKRVLWAINVTFRGTRQ